MGMESWRVGKGVYVYGVVQKGKEEVEEGIWIKESEWDGCMIWGGQWWEVEDAGLEIEMEIWIWIWIWITGRGECTIGIFEVY